MPFPACPSCPELPSPAPPRPFGTSTRDGGGPDDEASRRKRASERGTKQEGELTHDVPRVETSGNQEEVPRDTRATWNLSYVSLITRKDSREPREAGDVPGLGHSLGEDLARRTTRTCCLLLISTRFGDRLKERAP